MATSEHTHLAAQQEKHDVALKSVIAAAGLTGIKIIVGISTGSLGILAEAAHSSLDFVAAVTTYFAVRISGRPADVGHHYGHGKVENFSALIETLLLLATCIWIVWEASQRLLGYEKVSVEVNFWSFAVMATSIVVDVTRSRMLKRAAIKYNSQALEADALHFSTDVWSSSVVILGLACVKLSEYFPGLTAMHQLDSVAALIVAAIMTFVSIELGMRSVQALLDAAPFGARDEVVRVVESIPGVIDCHRVRVRHSGPKTFVDIHILVSGDETLRNVHALTDRIEEALAVVIPEADVTVHPEPPEGHEDDKVRGEI